MKKLLIITNIPSPYRVDFFEYLQKTVDDFEIHILFQSGNEGSFRKWSGGEERLINVHTLRSKVIRATGKDITEKFLPSGCGAEIESIFPDVVVSMEYNAAALMAKHWCNKNHVPYISWSDGTRYAERNIRFYQKIFRKYIVRKTAAFIASSTKTRENQIYLGADPERIYISELAIDIRRYGSAGRNYRHNGTLVAVGGLIERKGIDLLLNALSLIKNENWELHLVGEGPEKANLERRAEELGIAEKVIFKGFMSGDDLTAEYENAGIFVFPTREDCFGLVTLEAMCCGLPVIASKYADSSYDLIDEGKTGFIIDPFNSKAFSDSILKLLRDEKLANDMSVAGKEKTCLFGFEKTSVGFMNAVRSVF
ncbi:MAG: glycosyltransferase family 4 protein [Lachnospiraceae bacterium]|nr:glycosyltransferase family 4 protein [Lachnospiraceae bacterium]